ncbi:glycine--tRNA ligase [Candidatus Bathyarchaeota archaeon]|nr:MAG: glycine--tRNA ligase [Candidatus Bathyarchaeota archaeon]
MAKKDKYELVSELARRRGFFWPAIEIYGGVSGFICYGPLGVLLKERIIRKFREIYVKPLGALEIDSPVIMPERVFEASGHVEHFKEPMVECLSCGRKFRADHLLEEAGLKDAEKLSLEQAMAEIASRGVRCPECGGDLGKPSYFTTMFVTTIGPYSDAIGYGRPEAAQGIFVEFRRLYEQARKKLPFAVVQIGRALRNEISPRQGPIRLREFTIIDYEFFFDPEEPSCPRLPEVEDEVLRLVPAEVRLKGSEEPLELTVREALERGYIKMEWMAYFMALAKRFLEELGVPGERQRFIEKLEWERAHYSVQGYDQEVWTERWGWVEVSGHNYRTDYDLGRHTKWSGVELTAFKELREPVVVVELSVKPKVDAIKREFGDEAPRVLKLLAEADKEAIARSLEAEGRVFLGPYVLTNEHLTLVRSKKEVKGKHLIPHVIEPSFGLDRLVYVTLEHAYSMREGRVVLKLPRDVAPVQLAVLPLVGKNGLPEKAREVYELLLSEGFEVEYDEAGSIGRRYARCDEIGVPIAITIDYRTLEDGTVTLRDRDTWRQVRTPIEGLPTKLHAFFKRKLEFDDLGEPV